MNFLRLYSRVAWLLFFALTILFLDFFSKAYVFHVLTFQHEAPLQFFEIPVFHNLLGIDFTISLATNTGMAWGLFANFQTILLVIRLVAIFLMCVYLFFFNTNRALEFPLVLIITGALGNVIDFFLYGFVVDFLHFNLWGYHFPVFNFADTAITIGVFWLFFASLMKKKSVQNNA